jgi:predicted MFS family arabinose efflux permease
MLDGVRAPLKSRPFRRVWAGETVAQLGDLAFQIAFAWLVVKQAGPATLGAVMLTQAAPRGVLMLLGGAVTDRFSPRTVMLATHLTRGLTVAVVAVLTAAGHLSAWQFFLVAAVIGAAEAFFWPASASIVPALVPAEHLPRALGLVTVSEQLARMLGPVLGGLAVATTGTTWAFGLESATFFAAVAMLLATPAHVRSEDGEQPGMAALKKEIGEGLRYAFNSRQVRTVLMMVSAAALSYSGLFAVGLPALARSYSGSASALGVLVSAWGVGQLTGALAASVTGLPQRWGLLMIGMTLCEGSAFAVLGLVPRVWAAAAVLALLGIGVAYSSDVALPLFIQTRTPKEFLGRINSILNLPRMVFEPISMAAMGFLVSFGVRWGLAGAAVPMLAVGLVLACDRDARHLRMAADPRTPGPADPQPIATGVPGLRPHSAQEPS